MSELDELRAEVAALREQVAQEAGLRAAVDRDQSDLSAQLRGQDRLLRALSATQSEHTGAISALMGRVDVLVDEVRSQRAVLSRLHAGQALAASGQQEIVRMLNTLIERGD